MSAVLTDAQRLDWLCLIRTESIGPRSFRTLVNRFGGAGAALAALPDLARRAGRSGLAAPSRADAEREIERLARIGGRLIGQGEPDYPRTLLAIDTAPPLIAVRGSAAALAQPTIAIVGSRNASASGGVFTERLAADLGREGYVVVSGLARGIDSRAHRAALATGTVAVLAGGHDKVYPAENEGLLDRIVAEGGAAVTEMPIGWTPRGRDFPRRNRIVSGLSYGTIVVEAALRSGSLITARFALEQGREVFAVPGSPLDPRAEGTNDLIRGGATLCARVDHVTAVLRPIIGDSEPWAGASRLGADEGGPHGGYDHESRLWEELDLLGDAGAPSAESPDEAEAGAPGDASDRVLSLLGPAPVSIDDLARHAELPVRQVQGVLVELEMAGRIERHANNSVSRTARVLDAKAVRRASSR